MALTAADAAGKQPRTVLVVDDVASVRYFHHHILAKLGFKCLSASNGAEAVEQIRQNRVDIVLLDVVMPEMGGQAFIQEMRNRSDTAGIPILVVSSEQVADQVRRERTGSCGPVGFAQKPILPSAILAEVERLLAA